MMFRATIEVLVEVPEGEPQEGFMADAISESLRPLFREFDPKSPLIDWRYRHDGSKYMYGEPDDGDSWHYE